VQTYCTPPPKQEEKKVERPPSLNVREKAPAPKVNYFVYFLKFDNLNFLGDSFIIDACIPKQKE
jgi:hypothetical protein